jgi:predicted nucleic acid-binding protein
MISLDTNILICAFDPSDTAKHRVAATLLKRAIQENAPIAAQVYGEFFTATVRRGIATRTLASEVIDSWSAMMTPISSSIDAHTQARALATEHQFQYWDALIIATCAEHGVTQLHTEDIPGKAKPLGVRCTNPFKR